MGQQTDYSKNMIILELKIQDYSTQIKKLKKGNTLFNTTVQELKTKKILLEKIEITLMP